MSFSHNLSRLEKLMEPYHRGITELVQNALKSANMNEGDISDIIISGGSSRIPCVTNMIQAMFPGKLIIKSYQTDETLVEGAGNIFFKLWKLLFQLKGQSQSNHNPIFHFNLGVISSTVIIFYLRFFVKL